ncbi:MAG: polyprenyl synthetase family protein [Lentisphaeria bacterium]|nr:polyprenyl synthetase family protein [Lentisphaeria bacterium]NLZ59073.1 polyprenyl synthetase family protein [Lentisphaerota bacterium]
MSLLSEPALFTQRIYALIHQESALHADFLSSHLRQASLAYFKQPGKCLRPRLLVLACLAAGGEADDAMPAAAAVEVFHTWTLLHDDIIDHDHLRRGQPSAHVLGAQLARQSWALPEETANDYGRSLAILAGDLLQGQAMHLIAGAPRLAAELKNLLLAKMCAELYPQLLGGEQIDVELSFRKPEHCREEDILEMMRLKTGALLSYCAWAGVMLAGQDKQELAAQLAQFAEFCGIAFQLQDDILGVTGNEQRLGKSIASDLREGKRTVLLCKAWQKLNQAQKEHLGKTLGNPQCGSEELEEARQIIINSGAIEASAKLAQQYIDKAENILDKALPDCEDKQNLRQWSQAMLNRKH